MSIKSEPMEFEMSGLDHSAAIPLQLVANATVTDDRTAMQTTRNSVISCPDFNGMNRNIPTTDELLRTDRLVSEHGSKVYSSSQTRYPNFTIARGEIELNSKYLPKKYRCGFCVYKTSYKSDLNRHLRRHTQNADFHCEECKMPFKTEGLLYHHRRIVHEQGKTSVKRIYQCHICPYTTPFEVRYSRHMSLHSTCKYACDVCNKPFLLEAMLKHHKESDHGIMNASDRFDSNLCGITHVGNIRCDFHVPSATNQSSFQSSSFEAVLDSHNREALSLSSAPNVNGSTGSNGDEIIGDWFQVTSVLPHTLPKEGGNESVIKSCLDEVSQPSNVNGNESVIKSCLDEVSQPSNVNGIQISFESTSSDSNRVDLSLEQSDTRNQLTQSRLGTAGYDSPTVYNNSPREMEVTSELVSRSVKAVLGHQNESVTTTPASQNKQYCCEHCGIAFTSLDGILNHKPTCPSENLNPVKACSLCPFQTISEDVFQRHFQKHSMAPYCCELCNRPFIAVANLMKHKRDVHRSTWVRNTSFSRSPKNFNRLLRTQRTALSSRETVYSTAGVKENKSFDTVDLHSRIVKKYKKETEMLVSSQPPESGRYAKLVSNFDEFAYRPYACALCFFRTSNMVELSRHVENHLTGCNFAPIPETARFIPRYNCETQSHNAESKPSNNAGREPLREKNKIFRPVQNHHDTNPTASVNGVLSNGINYAKTQEQTEINDLKSCAEEMKSGSRPTLVGRQKCAGKFVKRRKELNDKVFVYKSSLPGRTRFSCSVCGKSFGMKVVLLRHLNKIHGSCTEIGYQRRQ